MPLGHHTPKVLAPDFIIDLIENRLTVAYVHIGIDSMEK